MRKKLSTQQQIPADHTIVFKLLTKLLFIFFVDIKNEKIGFILKKLRYKKPQVWSVCQPVGGCNKKGRVEGILVRS